MAWYIVATFLWPAACIHASFLVTSPRVFTQVVSQSLKETSAIFDNPLYALLVSGWSMQLTALGVNLASPEMAVGLSLSLPDTA